MNLTQLTKVIEILTPIADKDLNYKVSALLAAEISADLVRSTLKEQYTLKDINASIKLFTPEKTKSAGTGLLERYRNWLAEDKRSEQEAFDYIIELGKEAESVNIIAHMGMRLDEWELAERVRAGLEGRKAEKRRLAGLNRAKAIAILGGTPLKTTPKKANKAVEAGEVPVYVEEESTQSKEFRRVLTAIAKGEYKTVTVVRNQLKVLHDDELTTVEADKLWAMQEFAGDKGVKLAAIQKKAIEIANQ